MGVFISTVTVTVQLPDLGIILAHPTIDYDLAAQFTGEDLKQSVDLTTAILSGDLTWKKDVGGNVQRGSEYDSNFLEIETEAIIYNVPIAAGDTAIVEAFLLTEFKTTKYYVEVFHPTTNRRSVRELIACKNSSGGVTDSIGSKIGDAINVEVNFITNATDAQLTIANNEAEPVVVRVTRLTI